MRALGPPTLRWEPQSRKRYVVGGIPGPGTASRALSPVRLPATAIQAARRRRFVPSVNSDVDVETSVRPRVIQAGAVRNQNSGRFVGTPTRRGNRSGHRRSCWMETNRRGCSKDRRFPIPSCARPAAGHRSLTGCDGGSDTTSTPSTSSSGAAHSATTAGGPKARAVAT